jgi:hypothetical protein
MHPSVEGDAVEDQWHRLMLPKQIRLPEKCL